MRPATFLPLPARHRRVLCPESRVTKIPPGAGNQRWQFWGNPIDFYRGVQLWKSLMMDFHCHVWLLEGSSTSQSFLSLHPRKGRSFALEALRFSHEDPKHTYCLSTLPNLVIQKKCCSFVQGKQISIAPDKGLGSWYLCPHHWLWRAYMQTWNMNVCTSCVKWLMNVSELCQLQFNGHFRNLNWRYLLYIRPM